MSASAARPGQRSRYLRQGRAHEAQRGLVGAEPPSHATGPARCQTERDHGSTDERRRLARSRPQPQRPLSPTRRISGQRSTRRLPRSRRQLRTGADYQGARFWRLSRPHPPSPAPGGAAIASAAPPRRQRRSTSSRRRRSGRPRRPPPGESRPPRLVSDKRRLSDTRITPRAGARTRRATTWRRRTSRRRGWRQ